MNLRKNTLLQCVTMLREYNYVKIRSISQLLQNVIYSNLTLISLFKQIKI